MWLYIYFIVKAYITQLKRCFFITKLDACTRLLFENPVTNTWTQVWMCMYVCTLVHSNASLTLEEWNGYVLNGKFQYIADPIILYYTVYMYKQCSYGFVVK